MVCNMVSLVLMVILAELLLLFIVEHIWEVETCEGMAATESRNKQMLWQWRCGVMVTVSEMDKEKLEQLIYDGDCQYGRLRVKSELL